VLFTTGYAGGTPGVTPCPTGCRSSASRSGLTPSSSWSAACWRNEACQEVESQSPTRTRATHLWPRSRRRCRCKALRAALRRPVAGRAPNRRL